MQVSFIGSSSRCPLIQDQVFISVGGWDAGGKIFSNMVSSSTNRAAFISSALQFCRTYAFDGIDTDWECKYHAGSIPRVLELVWLRYMPGRPRGQ